MKIEILKDKIEQPITALERIASKNTSLPVLEAVCLEVVKNKLFARATNLEMGIEFELNAKILESGSVAIPAGVFKRFLSSINDKKITIEENQDGVLVKSDQFSTKIKTLPVDDFPSLPKPKTTKKHQIDATNILDGLKSVWFSASPGSLKPELSSVYIKEDSKNLTFVATDSFRLAEKKVFNVSFGGFESVLIPLKNTPEIIKHLEASDRRVDVLVGENQISFQNPNMYLTSRTIDGDFPDYKQIIPKEYQTEVVLLKQDLIEALKITQIFANKFNQINFKINPKNKSFVIHSKNEETGENQHSLKSTINGDAVDISFNHRYVMDCFQSIPQDSVVLRLSGPGKPMVISGVGDDTFRYLVMPMNK